MRSQYASNADTASGLCGASKNSAIRSGVTRAIPSRSSQLKTCSSLVGGTILFKRFAPKGDLWIGNGVQSLVAGLALAPVAFGTESVADIVPSWRLLAAFAYLVLLVSVCAYLLWFRILAVSGATAASSYHFLMPPLGLLFGWMLLGEHVAPLDLIGIVPVALGIYLVTRPART